METKICKDCGKELPISHFKMSRWGNRVDICTDCANEKRRSNRIRKQQEEELEKTKAKNLAESRQHILEGFTPRELMSELARRGYCGNLTYTQTIDICNF